MLHPQIHIADRHLAWESLSNWCKHTGISSSFPFMFVGHHWKNTKCFYMLWLHWIWPSNYTVENPKVLSLLSLFFLGRNTPKMQSEHIGFQSGCQRGLLRTPSWKMLVSLEALPCDTSDMGEDSFSVRRIEANCGSWNPKIGLFLVWHQAICCLVIKSLTQDPATARLEDMQWTNRPATSPRVAYAGRACPEKAVLPGKGFDHRRRVEEKCRQSQLGLMACYSTVSEDCVWVHLIKPCMGMGQTLLYTTF